MQVIISPAKQMRADSDAFAPRDIPPFPDKTDQILRTLRAIERDQGPQGLQALWGVSVKLLAENIERLHAFAPIMDARGLDDPALARLVAPAIFSYVGIQYQNMAPGVLDERALADAGIAVEDITERTIPEDFARNKRIHRCFIITNR